MATLYDETNMRKTSGNWKNLFEQLVTSYSLECPHIIKLSRKSKSGAERSAYATCKGQTRNQFRVVTPKRVLRLELSANELEEFNATYPIPE